MRKRSSEKHAELMKLYDTPDSIDISEKENRNMLLQKLAEAGDAIEGYYDLGSRGWGETNPIYRKMLAIIDAELALESVEVPVANKENEIPDLLEY